MRTDLAVSIIESAILKLRNIPQYPCLGPKIGKSFYPEISRNLSNSDSSKIRYSIKVKLKRYSVYPCLWVQIRLLKIS